MKFIVGYNLEKFKRYFEGLDDIHEYYRSLGLENVGWGVLGVTEEEIIRATPSSLIVWLKDDEIIGHAIWHESNTDEYRARDPRDEEDKSLLRELLGGKKVFVELHELWLKVSHRGKWFGKLFFAFFENYIKDQGYDSIIFYTGHPAAIALCRKRGYQEAFWEKEKWYIFHLELSHNTS